MRFIGTALSFMGGGGIWPLVIIAGICLAIGAGGTAWIEDYRIDGLRAETVAAKEQAAIARADAERWQKASGEREQAIADLNAQIQQITVDSQATTLAAIELVEEAQAKADATERKLAELRRQANAAPDADKPHPLSPSSRAAVDWGLCRTRAATAGTDPAAGCN